jgi:predicted dithiol-disulfide oxidoreductase (DUF899 family)
MVENPSPTLPGLSGTIETRENRSRPRALETLHGSWRDLAGTTPIGRSENKNKANGR